MSLVAEPLLGVGCHSAGREDQWTYSKSHVGASSAFHAMALQSGGFVVSEVVDITSMTLWQRMMQVKRLGE